MCSAGKALQLCLSVCAKCVYWLLVQGPHGQIAGPTVQDSPVPAAACQPHLLLTHLGLPTLHHCLYSLTPDRSSPYPSSSHPAPPPQVLNPVTLALPPPLCRIPLSQQPASPACSSRTWVTSNAGGSPGEPIASLEQLQALAQAGSVRSQAGDGESEPGEVKDQAR